MHEELTSIELYNMYTDLLSEVEYAQHCANTQDAVGGDPNPWMAEVDRLHREMRAISKEQARRRAL